MFDPPLNEAKQTVRTENYKPIKKSTPNGNCVKYESKKDKNLLRKEYIDMIKPDLRNIINNSKTQFRERKIQLTMAINSIFSEEACTMYTKSDSIKIVMGSETNDIIKKLCESSLQRYQERLKELMRKSNFVCGSADLLYYLLTMQSNEKIGDEAEFNPIIVKKPNSIC